MPHTLRPWRESRRGRDGDKDVTHKHTRRQEADTMTYSPGLFLLSTVGRLLLWRPSILSSLSPRSWTHCSPVTHIDVKTNTQINRQKQTHTHTWSTETCANPHPPTVLLSKPGVPHIATNISHELSATSPSWIFIKQNSKQIDFTPAALLHFYLILSLSDAHLLLLVLTSVSPLQPFTSSFLPDAYPTSSLYFLPVLSTISLFENAVLPSFPLSLVCLSFSPFPQASFSCQSWFMFLDLWPWGGLLLLGLMSFVLTLCVCVSVCLRVHTHICGHVRAC